MKLFASIALLVSAVAANPIARAAGNVTGAFHLKTVGASEAKHNDLYVYAYHTAAGFNDAVLTSDTKTANPAFLNNTHAQFALDTPFPWGFTMHPHNNYAAWEPVEINTGYGDEGFTIDGNGLQWSNSLFGGWLVCDWYHNEPQLFYLYKPYEAKFPSSCSRVNLQIEEIS
ncbi:hypothetical protein EYZ11_010900 [Aspergillus tanneri]|uniref:DUF7907 domain-containing protein n=1 Tax=Aspergillus tanneri TaxID=1220188 RepID=A0A4S3J4H8_9EURO|nr:uncharacterized protein ATNIH1004_002801 [Aspergillus tanneri]KAA8650120.1 hypothetical protein ATNIH1004_002801 [Aspergillus tanneri]THC89655.1 hypothetical protein EYZ11_010900 [Aspergillus tanneri]